MDIQGVQYQKLGPGQTCFGKTFIQSHLYEAENLAKRPYFRLIGCSQLLESLHVMAFDRSSSKRPRSSQPMPFATN